MIGGLREHVAEAIAADQCIGGTGILSDEEEAAIGEAIYFLRTGTIPSGQDETEIVQALAHIKAQLGSNRIYACGSFTRVDQYYLHCADVAIQAYDQWVEKRSQRTKETEA